MYLPLSQIEFHLRFYVKNSNLNPDLSQIKILYNLITEKLPPRYKLIP